MHILIFLHGTILMHPGGVGLSREQIVQQVRDEEASIRDYGAYVPIGNAVHKLQGWASQGATISYLSALTESKLARTDELVDAEALVLDQRVLERYSFPRGEIYHRKSGQHYAQIVERLLPEVLIEDDCESIGGVMEMTITAVNPSIQKRVKSIVVKEFGGIDELPDDIVKLLSNYQ